MQRDREIRAIRDWMTENSHVKPNNGVGSRKKENVYPRFYITYYMRVKLCMSYDQISEVVGYNNHATVINAVKQWEKLSRYRDVMYLTRDVRSAFPIGDNPLLDDPIEIECDPGEYVDVHYMSEMMGMTTVQSVRIATLLDIDRKTQLEYVMNVNGRSDKYVYNKKQILNRYGLCQ